MIGVMVFGETSGPWISSPWRTRKGPFYTEEAIERV